MALADDFEQFKVHFISPRHKPCTACLGPCELCTPTSPGRWSGFLAVMSLATRTQFILSITPGAHQNCPELEPLRGKLRGWIVFASRLGDTTQTGLRLQLFREQTFYPMPKVLPQFSLLDALSRWWDVDVELLERLTGRRMA